MLDDFAHKVVDLFQYSRKGEKWKVHRRGYSDEILEESMYLDNSVNLEIETEILSLNFYYQENDQDLKCYCMWKLSNDDFIFFLLLRHLPNPPVGMICKYLDIRPEEKFMNGYPARNIALDLVLEWDILNNATLGSRGISLDIMRQFITKIPEYHIKISTRLLSHQKQVFHEIDSFELFIFMENTWYQVPFTWTYIPNNISSNYFIFLVTVRKEDEKIKCISIQEFNDSYYE